MWQLDEGRKCDVAIELADFVRDLTKLSYEG